MKLCDYNGQRVDWAIQTWSSTTRRIHLIVDESEICVTLSTLLFCQSKRLISGKRLHLTADTQLVPFVVGFKNAMQMRSIWIFRILFQRKVLSEFESNSTNRSARHLPALWRLTAICDRTLARIELSLINFW